MTWIDGIWIWTEEDEKRHQEKILEAEAFPINNLDCPDSFQLVGIKEEDLEDPKSWGGALKRIIEEDEED